MSEELVSTRPGRFDSIRSHPQPRPDESRVRNTRCCPLPTTTTHIELEPRAINGEEAIDSTGQREPFGVVSHDSKLLTWALAPTDSWTSLPPHRMDNFAADRPRPTRYRQVVEMLVSCTYKYEDIPVYCTYAIHSPL